MKEISIKNKLEEIKEILFNELISGNFSISDSDEETMRFNVLDYKLYWKFLENNKGGIDISFSSEIGKLKIDTSSHFHALLFNRCLEKASDKILSVVRDVIESDTDQRKEMSITKINEVKTIDTHDLDNLCYLGFDFEKKGFKGSAYVEFKFEIYNKEYRPSIELFEVYDTDGNIVATSFEFIGGTSEIEKIVTDYCGV